MLALKLSVTDSFVIMQFVTGNKIVKVNKVQQDVPILCVATDKPGQTLIIGKALPRTHGNIVKLVFITLV